MVVWLWVGGLVVAGAGGCSPRVQVMVGDGGDAMLREQVVERERGDGGNKVVQIDVRGLIADSRSPGLLGPGSNPVDVFARRLDMAARDPRVRGVIVRINSPGGTVAGTEAMHAELVRFRARTGVPVVASMGEVAASGGYYLALGADEIVAQPTTITGSIGVIFPTINVSQGLGWIGVTGRAVTSGPNKDLANPLVPPREEHYAILQGMVDDFAGRFVALVRSRRPGLAAGDVAEATDGRVMTGSRAREIGLVDSTGTLRDAFARVKALAGIEAATWVKYRAEEAVPGSIYARGGAEPEDGGSAAGGVAGRIGAGVAQEVAAMSGMTPPGFYYVWQAGIGAARLDSE
jgi:protease-4